MYKTTLILVFLLEMIFRVATVGIKITDYLWLELIIILLISVAVATVPFLLKNILSGKKGKVTYAVVMIALAFCYGAQVVYHSVFGTFFTAYSAVNGIGQAFEFYEVILENIWDEKFVILLISVVTIPLVIWSAKEPSFLEKNPWKISKKRLIAICLLIIVATIGTSNLIISIKSDNPKSPYQKIFAASEMKSSVECCGLLGAMTIDSYRAIFGFEPKIEVEENFTETVKEDNVIESLNFKELAANEKNETLKKMHQYFGAQIPSKENEKTGVFEGKNLIFITAEAFSDMAVDPTYTPTLYKLQNEGYTFSNFYNPIWGTSTIDGEYVNLQGLVPKSGAWAMKESAYNYLPFTLGNQFMSMGYNTKAFHNHSIYFYERDLSHPNLGYDFRGQGREYFFEEIWPESDIEMIDQTTWEFLTPDEEGKIKPFHTYYLTVSGHLAYNFYGNNIAMKNEELVEGLQMSDSCRAYMATQIELDRAVELLIQRLDEAGVLEDTVIAIAGDHYPYGLTVEEISEFKGHTVDEEYEMYKGTFILWTPGIKHKNVEKVCSNMDILPTLSNMFALEYDSRLLMGKDIFSEGEGFVVFKDKNWISDKGTRSELEEIDSEYVQKMDKVTLNMFNYSNLILDNDYYGYLLKQE